MPEARSGGLLVAAVALVLIAVAAPVGQAATPAQRCAFPAGGEEFTRSEASRVGLDGTRVQEALDFATSRNAASVRIYRHGCLVGTSRLDPVTGDLPNNVWSTTKGVVALLAGRAHRLGVLDLDAPIGRYLPPGMGDAAHRAITVRQLLTQSSGLRLNWVTEAGEIAPDTVRYTLALPFDHRPGTRFTYGQTTVTLLAHVVERAAGEDLQDFTQKQLFDPLGIDRGDWFWRRDRAGNTHGFAHLYLTPADMARLGHLMLNQGRWHGQQLISPKYVREASAPSAANPFYGYLLWINRSDHGYTVDMPDRRWIENHRLIESAPRDLYAFVGFLDQIIFVIPSLDMVVVRTGYGGNHALDGQALMTAHTADWMHEFFRILMRGVQDKHIPDPGPYRGDEDFSFDKDYFVDPDLTAGAIGIGPYAPDNCDVLGCDGEIAYEGVTRAVQDIVPAGS